MAQILGGEEAIAPNGLSDLLARERTGSLELGRGPGRVTISATRATPTSCRFFVRSSSEFRHAQWWPLLEMACPRQEQGYKLAEVAVPTDHEEEGADPAAKTGWPPRTPADLPTPMGVRRWTWVIIGVWMLAVIVFFIFVGYL